MTISEAFGQLILPATPEGAAFCLMVGMAVVWFFWRGAR